MDAIRTLIAPAKASPDKHTLIRVNTIIGYGTPNKTDSRDAHGAPPSTPMPGTSVWGS